MPHESVFAVIEVKTSIDAKRFGEALFAFERLEQIRVGNKYLFLYDGCKIETLRKYFFSNHTPIYGHCYDYDDYHSLPDAIISLNNDYFLAKASVETIDSRDKMGYMAFTTYDNSDKSIACLQEFVFRLMEIVAPTMLIRKPIPEPLLVFLPLVAMAIITPMKLNNKPRTRPAKKEPSST